MDLAAAASSDASGDGTARRSRAAATRNADTLDAAVRLARLRRRMFGSVATFEVGAFQVLRKLGEGGMGVVYAAWDSALDRLIALKLLRDTTAEDGADLLRREAIALAKLRHPNVVTVYAVGTHEGHVYVAMEFIEGQTLRASFRGSESAPRPAVKEVLGAFRQVARGLAAAHDVGLIHRDVKPDNMMVDADGHVRIVDFGLARVVGAAESTTAGDIACGDSSATGSRYAGTVGYVAPEVLAGESPSPASDQYAFCVSLFEALSGARPVHGNETVDLTPVAGAPRALRRILARGLASAPADRWPSMAIVSRELELASRPSRLLWWVAAGVALIGSVGGAFALAAQPNPCEDGHALLGEAWSATQRAAVAEHVQSAGTARGVASVLSALDDYAERWAAEQADACHAARVAFSQPERVFELRARCLDRRRSAMAALTQALASVSTEDTSVADLLHAANALEPIESCRSLDYLESDLLVPADPVQRGAVARGRDALDRVRVEALFKGADSAELERLHEQSKAIGFAPFEAEISNVMALLAQRAGDDVRSEALTLEMLDAAEVAGNRTLVADAWIRLLGLAGRTGSDLERLEFYARRAAVASTRAGPSLTRDIERTTQLASGYYRLLALDKARIQAEQAVALSREREPLDLLGLARALNVLGTIQLSAGEPDLATLTIEDALATCAEAMGPEDWLCLSFEVNLAGIQLSIGDLDAAEQTIESALRGSPAHSQLRAFALRNRAAVGRARGEHEQATLDAREALGIVQALLGPKSSDARLLTQLLGTLLRETQRCDEALPLLDGALADPYRGTNDSALVTALMDRAKCRVALGVPGAIDDVQTAVSILEAQNDRSARHGNLMLLRAEIEADTDPVAARASLAIALPLLADIAAARSAIEALQARLDAN